MGLKHYEYRYDDVYVYLTLRNVLLHKMLLHKIGSAYGSNNARIDLVLLHRHRLEAIFKDFNIT